MKIGWAGCLALGLPLLLAGCSTGAYPIDLAPEMHYQPSYRSQEPPRPQPAPEAVPVTGREVSYSLSEARGLVNPVPRTAEGLARAARVFAVECSFCHGPGGRGDGAMALWFQRQGVTPPVDFASLRVRARTEGELYWLISNGIGNMPPFGKLIAPADRWLLVHRVRSIAQSTP